MEYLVFLIPIFFICVSIFKFNKKVTWWELCIQLVGTVIVLAIMKVSFYKYNVSDTEYIGGITKTAVYNEEWNERVSCRHPIYCTRTVGSGKNRRTESYVCGHHHAYDVDYHPANYYIETTLGDYSITASKFNELKNRFGNVRFVELNRHYHSIDGDRYVTDWNNCLETIEPVSESHSYDNKIQCCKNVLGYDEISDEDVTRYGLYQYPDVKNNMQKCIIPDTYSTQHLDFKINQINGYIGLKKQARLFVMVFEDKDQMTALREESYLVGGNKNEVILTIGVDKQTKEIRWAKVFSWTEVQILKLEIQDFVNEQHVLTPDAMDKILTFSCDEIMSKFKRKEFKDFSYLAVDISDTQMTWLFIIVLLINIGVFAFNVMNEFEN